MGLTNLPGICERLVQEGRAASTPAAVIERGTTPGQRVVTGTLDDLAERVADAGLHPPSLIVVGDVVRLRDQLAWHDAQPLAGRRILVPRVRRRPSEIVRLLKAAGAETTEVPVLRSETLSRRRISSSGSPPPSGWSSPRRARSRRCWSSSAGPAATSALSGRRGSRHRAGDAAHLRRCGLRVDYAPETAAGFAGGFPAPAPQSCSSARKVAILTPCVTWPPGARAALSCR